MRILLHIIQFPPDVNSTGLLMEQVCEELMRCGHEVWVITSFPHYAQFRVWDAYRGRLAQLDDHYGLRVIRLSVYASGTKQNMRHRLANYLSFNALATVANLLTRKRFDVVLCTNGSFFSGVSAFASGLVTGTPFIYNVQDLYPETPAQAGQLQRSSSVRILQQIARFMYHTAAHITVITPSFRDYIIEQGIPADKISVIPNFVNTQFIRPLPKINPFSERFGLTNKFVISHAGNLGYVYDLGTLLEAAARLRDYRDIEFLIIGDGVAKPDLERKAQESALDNVRFLPFQPGEDLPYLRAASDVQVSLYKYGAAKNSMPSKVYEIMASGRPILASAEQNSDVRNLIDSAGFGVCVDSESVEQLTEAILALYENPQRREQMARHGRQAAEQHYSREAVGAQYNHLLQQVAARRRR
jgi:colanic acid biosynthesis glycosyl transferase WcaI